MPSLRAADRLEASSPPACGTQAGVRPVRVALDVAHTRQGTGGASRYTAGLRTALAARADVTVIALGGGPLARRGSAAQKFLALRQDLLWYPLLGRRAAGRASAAIYHCTAQRAPLTRGTVPLVVSVHDLVVLRHPHTMSSWNRLYTRATIRRMLGAADRVIAPTEDSADDLERLARVPTDKLRIVPIGIDAHFYGAPAAPAPLREPYVLFVGSLEPRKNLPRLVQAVRELRRRGFRELLVIAGGDGWGGERLGDDGIQLLGHVSDETLHALYARASCLAIPSLHEGFGLPAVEAMAAGCPVVASERGALPEVCGDAAVLVDPLDVGAIATGIERAIAQADVLRALGRRRAADFTWTRAAERLVAVYRELV